jgi:hypothetical protein
MVRTQIQLPDALYRELKALASDKEWSLAEAVRRGAELLLRSHPARRLPDSAAELPLLSLGGLLVDDEALRAYAHERGPEQTP